MKLFECINTAQQTRHFHVSRLLQNKMFSKVHHFNTVSTSAANATPQPSLCGMLPVSQTTSTTKRWSVLEVPQDKSGFFGKYFSQPFTSVTHPVCRFLRVCL